MTEILAKPLAAQKKESRVVAEETVPAIWTRCTAANTGIAASISVGQRTVAQDRRWDRGDNRCRLLGAVDGRALREMGQLS